MDERARAYSEKIDESENSSDNQIATRFFTLIEHWITMGIGGILVIITLLLLTGTLSSVRDVAHEWPRTDNIFLVVDKLLFTLMLVEILHTVRQSITSKQIAIEPFLIVGLIASVRRILIVTVEVANEGKPPNPPAFQHAMIELGVLGALTLVLIISIYVSRSTRRFC